MTTLLLLVLVLAWQVTGPVSVKEAPDEQAAQAQAQAIQGQGYALAATIGAVGTLLTALLGLYYTQGSKARVAEANAQAKLEAAKAASANATELTIAYETAIGDMKDQHEAAVKKLETKHTEAILKLETIYDVRLAETNAQVTILTNKVAEADNKHLECVAKSAKMEGMLEMIERLYMSTNQKVDQLLNKEQGA